MGQFLLVYHGIPAETTGAYEVSLFWGLMVIGCMLGLVLLRLLDSQLILRLFGLGAVGCVLAALLGPTQVALIAFPLCGFALSVMWSIIFALALNSVAEHHGSFTGILCTGILGGALVPLAIGWLGDNIGLRERDVPDPVAAGLHHFDQLLGAAADQERNRLEPQSNQYSVSPVTCPEPPSAPKRAGKSVLEAMVLSSRARFSQAHGRGSFGQSQVNEGAIEWSRKARLGRLRRRRRMTRLRLPFRASPNERGRRAQPRFFKSSARDPSHSSWSAVMRYSREYRALM